MKKYLLPIVALAFAACSSNEQQASYSVVPLPQEVNLTQDSPFKLTRSTIIAYPENNPLLKRNAEFLAEYIAQSTGYTLQTKAIKEGESATGCITLGLNSEITNPEGYKLSTSAEGIRIEGQTENGVFYGIQTLRKSIPAVAQGATVLLPAGEINDAPRFAYRGMMLDVGRHFFPVEFIKEYIDLLALHNMNTLHWHLTEDQGWRIEIKKYPKLTEIGSTRNRTVIGHNTDQYDNTPYGGFYTQDEAREIVRYAQERYITIIPEIDLPGHMLAALASYPELGCTGGPYEVCPRWGVFEDVLCIGNEKTLPFLEDVMTEIIDIFPSKYIHIGGDEAPRTRWAKCPKCQALIRAKGLKADKEHSAEDRLQSYCMAHIEKFLNEKGRQIIGWDEILEGDVAPNATVMSWRGSAGGIKAAQMGHDVIMTPNTHCYFDYFQSTDKANEPYDAIGGYVPVEKVYSLEPTEGLNDEQKKHILGAQANLWTEYILSPEQVEYMVLPRMAALAEVQWTQPEKKDYKDFVKRLVSLVHLYQRDGLNYAKHIFDIQAEISTPQAGSSSERTAQITLSTVDNAPIYYTLDGSQPSEKSQQYDNTGITIDKTTQLQAIAIRPDGSELYNAIPASERDKGGHHTNWTRDSRGLTMNLGIYRQGLRFCQCGYDGSNLRPIGEFTGSGHPSFHHNGRWGITDCYIQECFTAPDRSIPIRLIDLETNTERALTRVDITTPGLVKSYNFRLDPHPVWCDNDNFLIFNAMENGARRVFLADMRKFQ